MREAPNDVSVTRVTRDDPWDHESDVLSLRSFPSTSILRVGGSYNLKEKRFNKDRHLCTCSSRDRHRSLFTVNLQFVAKQIIGQLDQATDLRVCFNAENIWECRLPREVTGLSKRVEFNSLPNVGTALRVLKKGTFWYKQLLKKQKLSSSVHGRHMARLLGGYQSSEGPEPMSVIKSRKINVAAVQRLRSILATVDGLLMQILLAFPGNGEFQDWKRIDQIQRSLIANLLTDYFRDTDPARITTFEKVKEIRKGIKEQVFSPVGTVQSVYVPRELSAIRTVLSCIRGKTPLAYLQGSILSQTRGGGVPPRNVYEKTLAATKATLTTPSDPALYKSISQDLAISVDHLYSDLLTRLGGRQNREKYFDSALREAKISLSDSGEFFTPTEQGGKLEAARRILQSNPEIPEISLHTGQRTGKVLTSSDPTGERLFHWACGLFTDRRRCYDRNNMSCRISLVAELGKYRTITVSTLQHAVLLHVISHIGLKLIEAFPSSESGVGAANHAWNFFKRISRKNPSADFLFKEKNPVVFSTDWKNATDFCDHYIAHAMLNRFLDLIGVPKWYRETACFALFSPRQVETLDRKRCPIDHFFTKRGVLMGDPVTKVVLHLYHLVGRRLACNLMHGLFEAELSDEESESDLSLTDSDEE